MLNLQKYRDLEAEVAKALGWSQGLAATDGQRIWLNPQGFVAQLPKWSNEDALVFDLMHQHKLWPFENKENGNYLVEYSTGGDLPGYHLEYVENHHSNKIALRCAILNALLKSIAAKKGH